MDSDLTLDKLQALMESLPKLRRMEIHVGIGEARRMADAIGATYCASPRGSIVLNWTGKGMMPGVPVLEVPIYAPGTGVVLEWSEEDDCPVVVYGMDWSAGTIKYFKMGVDSSESL